MLTIGRLTRALEEEMCAALDEGERQMLASLLARMVTQQEIMPAVHPAYRKLRATSTERGADQRRPSGVRKQGS